MTKQRRFDDPLIASLREAATHAEETYGSTSIAKAIREAIGALTQSPSETANPRLWGVSRVADNEQAVLLSFDRRPTDDELRDIHERLRSAAEPTAESAILREGDCPKCGRHWTVKGDPTAVVAVLAVHCICGHIDK